MQKKTPIPQEKEMTAKTNYAKHEQNKVKIVHLKEELQRKNNKQEAIRLKQKTLQEESDDNLADIISLKEQIRVIEKEMNKMIETESLYIINFKEELSIIEPKTVFENKVLLKEVLKAGRMKVKKGLKWEDVYREIDPIEVYVLLKSIIMQQPNENIAHIIGGGMSEEKVDEVKKNAYKRMRKMSIYDNLYL